MSKITEERLKRAEFAIERGLLEDIRYCPLTKRYDVSYDGRGAGSYDTLKEALTAWDNAEQGIFPRDEELDEFEDDDDFENYTPTWDEYDFDEDGYKVRRK